MTLRKYRNRTIAPPQIGELGLVLLVQLLDRAHSPLKSIIEKAGLGARSDVLAALKGAQIRCRPTLNWIDQAIPPSGERLRAI